VGLAAALQVADRDAEPLAGLGHRDVVGLLHWLERRDVHSLGERGAKRIAGVIPPAVEDVGRTLAPGRVGDLGDDAVEVAARRVEEDEGNRVEADSEVAGVGEQPHRAGGTAPEPLLDQVAGALRQGPALSREIVPVPEACRRRPSRRPERDPVEQLRELVQVQQRQQDPVAEGVRNLAETPVGDPPLVDGGGAHAASESSSATASIRCNAGMGSRGCGNGPLPPSRSATRSADQTPSSWKPQRQ
jgi:hypothetical protein